MSNRVFLAGATGAIGRRLTSLLLDSGYQVIGMTRSTEKAEALRATGAECMVLNAFDAEAVAQAVQSARPNIVVHQLTDLSGLREATTMDGILERNAQVRIEGTRNLVRAALAANVRRMVAQSIAWVYAPGPTPYSEGDPLDIRAAPPLSTTIRGVVALEDAVLNSPPLEGTVLRFGQFYGPGTGADQPQGAAPMYVHVDAAACAVLLAIERCVSGVFNVGEPNLVISTEKAERALKWRAEMRLLNRGARVDHL